MNKCIHCLEDKESAALYYIFPKRYKLEDTIFVGFYYGYDSDRRIL